MGPDIHVVSASDAVGDSETETNVGFGMDINFGVDVALARGVYAGLGLDFHPGTTGVLDNAPVDVSFFALSGFIGFAL